MIIRVSSLKKSYGKNNSYQKVLDNINIEFKSGEFICVLGESGSGKSTLLNILGGLDSDYEGSINIDNRNLKYIDLDKYRKENIGFIFQNFNLINNLSVIENVIVPIDKLDISYNEKKKRAYNMLRKLKIYNLKNKRINELSGGQKQRVAIARALINNPRIILADEPTGALDEDNSKNILEILKEINKEGKLVIVVTHSNKVIDYSTRVITIMDGKIINDKKIKKVKESKIDYNEENENKFFYLLKYGFRSLIKNKKKNIFITLASSIGIVGIILTLFIGESVKSYISDLITSKVDPLSYEIKRFDNNNTYSVEDINNIKKIKNIERVYEEINYNISSIEYNNNNYDLLYLDSFNNIELEDGDSSEFVLSKYLYDNINDKNIIGKKISVNIIDSFRVIKFDVKISGISKNTGISLVDDNMHAYINYEVLKKVYDENNLILNPTNLGIKVKDNFYIDEVKQDLKKINMECTNNNELLDELNSYLNIAIFVLSLFSSLSLIVSIIMISIIINITVLERIKEIGILRSLGYSKKNIRSIFNSEAFFLGLSIGFFSIFISSKFIKIISDIVKNKFEITMNDNNSKFYLFGLILSIGIVLIASFFPSKKASKQDPIKALKYE